MDLNSILNQVLDVAKNSASKLETGNQTIDSLTKVGGGAALGGILSMILGRSGGASLAKLGSLAVLGNLAYQAYQNYQKSQQNSQPNISENAFDVLNVNSGTWAVFEAIGPFPETLQDVWGRIYSEWFPSSGYEAVIGPEILWNENPDTGNPKYKSQIWIPVRKKA